MPKFSARLPYAGLSGSLLALFGSCTAYVPMLGAAPEIRAKSELEVSGGYSLTNRVDLAAAYSPAPHLLPHAATSLKGGRADSRQKSR